MMNIKLHRLQTGAQQVKVLKRQLGEQLIAKLGLVWEMRHGLPFLGKSTDASLSAACAHLYSASDERYYSTIYRCDRDADKNQRLHKGFMFVPVQFYGT